jgi:hypothetical protein
VLPRRKRKRAEEAEREETQGKGEELARAEPQEKTWEAGSPSRDGRASCRWWRQGQPPSIVVLDAASFSRFLFILEILTLTFSGTVQGDAKSPKNR